VPNDSYSYYVRGVAMIKIGKLKESFICFKKSHNFNPNFKPAKTVLNNLSDMILKIKNEETPKNILE
jgi:hypothetical protein